jgi:hypothetical protein
MTAPGGTRTLDVYEIACLAGGLDRVVDTALVALVQSGRVRVHHPGQLVTADLSRRHPVEAAVLDAVGPSGHRSVDTIRWRLAADERLLDVVRRLRRDGLLGRRLPGWPGGPTAAGRRALRRVTARTPPEGVGPGSDAVMVALHGPAGWPHELRAAIFAGTRTVRPFTRGSRSTDPAQAAAEAQRDVRRTHALIHGGPTEWFAPSGPVAPPVRPFRGRRP